MELNEVLAEDLLENILEVIEQLKAANESMPIIVEGEADVRTLRELGLKGELIPINTGQSIFNFCEELSKKYSRVIILTDWDRKGGHLSRILSEDLKANDVYYELDFRSRLARYCKKETKDVEGLAACIFRLQRKVRA